MSRLAPGPGGNPIEEQLRPFEHDPLGFLLDAQRAYGDVVRLQLWPQLYHLISHPEGMRHVLAGNSANYHWLPSTVGGDDVIGTRMSRLAHHISHRDRLAVVAPAMRDAVDSALARWEPRAECGEPIDMAGEMVRLALVIVGTALFEVDLSEDLPELIPALGVILHATAPQRRVSLYQVLKGPGGPAALAEAQATVGRLISRLVDQRRRSGGDGSDLLSTLVSARDEASGEPLADSEVRAMAMVFLVSGHSAVADAMVWTMYLLAEHPDHQRLIREEVDAVLGVRGPAPADMPRLAYTLMVLREAIRLYPPVWMLAPRMALREDTIGGYRIPRGSMILMSPYVTHRHPGLWDRPEAFDPGRFSGQPPAGYFPFGVGPWSCLGAQFGLLEARLVLASAAQRYRWELASGDAVEPEPQVSLRPRDGLRLVMERRDRSREGVGTRR
jgi:cytochrome P450